MNHRESPVYWSFPCGTWFLTRVRVSLYFPLLVLIICWQLRDLQLGLIFSGILFASVVFHEFGHVLAVRMTGGTGNEILIWPMGGLAFVQPAATFSSQFLTPAAGPLVNIALCGMTLVSVLDAGAGWSALSPLHFPHVTLTHDVPGDLLRLTFYANWMLFLANLIPVYPLDGGRMLRACLMTRYDSDVSSEIYIRVGLIVAFLLMIAGLLANSVWIVFIGAVVLMLNVQETQHIRASESYEESFMGYDFSQGYTSLERSAVAARERRPGWLERWRQARRAEKLRREREKTAQAERTVDELLDKVHAHGMASLTMAERRKLEEASARLREKGKERN